MHHNYIGTEHLLLGLLKEGSGVAACVLMDAGVEETRLVELIEDLIAPSSDVAVLDRIELADQLTFLCIFRCAVSAVHVLEGLVTAALQGKMEMWA